MMVGDSGRGGDGSVDRDDNGSDGPRYDGGCSDDSGTSCGGNGGMITLLVEVVLLVLIVVVNFEGSSNDRVIWYRCCWCICRRWPYNCQVLLDIGGFSGARF